MTNDEMDWQDDTVAEALGKSRAPKALTREELVGIRVGTYPWAIGRPIATVDGRMPRLGTTPLTLYIPDRLHEELETQCVGAKGTVILGLIEWGLQELKRQNLALDVAVGFNSAPRKRRIRRAASPAEE